LPVLGSKERDLARSHPGRIQVHNLHIITYREYYIDCNVPEEDKIYSRGRSILRHRRVHLIAPGQNAALHVADLAEAGLLEEVDGFGAAHAALAVGHDFVGGVELVDALGEVA
jgi:hypothetical protein